MSRHELFLSHASPNRRFVERLARALKERGVRFFYSKRHIVGARQWHDELGDALARCDWFVLVLSKASVKSIWVKRELLFALEASQYRDRILPVLLEKCAADKLSWTLSAFQHIDFTDSFDDGFTALLAAIKTRVRKAARAGTKKKPKRGV